MANEKLGLDSIFAASIEIESPNEREEYLARACAGEAELKRQVERLLDAHFRAGNFLESPAPGLGATALAPPVTETIGTMVGPYKLREQIGEGGMGVVYVAEQLQPVRRKVALKVIKPGMDTKQVIARFEAERQALALMDHPNIAKVLEAGTADSGRPYFVMEFVRGIPITEYCDQARLTPRKRLELFILVCQAVKHAHQKGIIHRDIKPSNVLVTLHDGVPVPKVIDFGVAKAINQRLTQETIHTQATQMVGTPLYMSPEQAELSGLDIDTRTDVYSLGVLLYELLTGSTPFDRETLRKASYDEIRRIIREEEPSKPSTLISTLGASLTTVSDQRGIDPRKLTQTVRGELDWIVMKALEKDRTRRYESASALAADVGAYLNDEPVAACPPSTTYRVRKFARRNRAPLATAAVIFLALLAASGAKSQHDRAFRETTVSVGESLAAARAFYQARDYVAASQRLAEAQGRLREAGLDQGALALAVSDLDEKVSAKTRAEERLNQFKQLQESVYSRMYHLRGEEQLKALEDCRSALDLYRVLDGQEWKPPSEFRELDPSEQTAVRRALVELLFLTARLEIVSTYRVDNRPKGHRRAIDALRRIEIVDRPIPAVYLWIAESWGTLSEEKLAQEATQRATNLSPTSGLDYYVLGEYQQFHESYDQALKSYSLALRHQPDHFLALLGSGRTLFLQKRYELAEATLTGAIAVNSRTAFAYYLRGVCNKERGKLDLALADFSKLAELNPEDYLAYYSQGLLLYDKGDFAQAIAMFDKALAINPNSHSSHLNRGEAYARLGEHEKAVADFDVVVSSTRKNVRLKPVNRNWMKHLVAAYLNRALAQLKLGRYAKAVADAEDLTTLPADYLSPSDAYNAACVYSLAAGQVAKDEAEAEREALAQRYADRAVEGLRRAVEKGFRDFDHMRKDTDLDAIREHPKFRQLLKEIEPQKETKKDALDS